MSPYMACMAAVAPSARISAVLLLLAGCAPKPQPPPSPVPASVLAPLLPAPVVIEAAAEVGETEQAAALDPIYFDFDSTSLSYSATSALRQVAPELSGQRVIVSGHCDERGTTEYNLALGQRRADAVRGYLEQLGLEPGRLVSRSYGEERPADPGHDDAAHASNRRVEFEVFQ